MERLPFPCFQVQVHVSLTSHCREQDKLFTCGHWQFSKKDVIGRHLWTENMHLFSYTCFCNSLQSHQIKGFITSDWKRCVRKGKFTPRCCWQGLINTLFSWACHSDNVDIIRDVNSHLLCSTCSVVIDLNRLGPWVRSTETFLLVTLQGWRLFSREVTEPFEMHFLSF